MSAMVPDFECAQIVGFIKNLRGSGGRHFDDTFQRQTERQKLAHRCWHVVDRTVDVHRVKVRADRGWFEAVVESRLGNMPVETAESVTDVEDDTSVSGSSHGFKNFAFVVKDRSAAGSEAVSDAVAWRQRFGQLRNRHRTVADVYHQPGVGISRGFDRVVEIRPALLTVSDDIGGRHGF